MYYFSDDIIVMQNLHGQCNSIWNPLVKELLENTYTINSHSEEQVYTSNTFYTEYHLILPSHC